MTHGVEPDRPAFLVGLVGAGIQASLSPALHQAEADAQQLRLLYRLIDLERLGCGAEALPRLLDAAAWLGFCGLNITYPCKQQVIPLLDELSPEAARLGAVNTVVLRDGRRVGHNTDAPGFAAGFRDGLPGAALDCVVQLGAGGAGSAVAHALLELGAGQLRLVDTEAARAQGLAGRLCALYGAHRAVAVAQAGAALAGADGLVHATPTGMAKFPGLPLPAALLHPALWVAEIVYFPLETALLREARRLGCRTLDGGGMAVHQAAQAFALFTGRPADARRMAARFRELTAGPAP